MAYNIIKHRRGTTQEWIDIDLIPEDGELVIEECIDGTRKCKIGNGIEPFSKLHYIDEAVQTQLLEELDRVKQESEAYAEGRFTALQGQLVEAKQESLSALNNAKSELTSAIKVSADKISKESQQKLDSAIEGLAADLRSELSTVSDKLEKGFTEAEESLNREVSVLDTKLVKQGQENSIALAKVKTDLTNTFNKQLENEALVRRTQDEVLADSIETVRNSLETEIQPAIKELEETHNKTLTAAEDSLTRTIETTANELHSEVEDLDSKIDNHINESRRNLTTKLAEMASSFSTELSETSDGLHREIEAVEQATETSITSLSNKIDLTIAEKEKLWLDSLTELREKLMAADAELTNTINKLEQQGVTFSENTEGQLTALHNKALSLAEKDVLLEEAIAQLSADSKISDEITLGKLDELQNQRNRDYAKLLGELASLEESFKVNTTALSDSMVESVARIYAELADLVDDDILILNKAFSVEIQTKEALKDLDAKIDDEIAGVSEALSLHIENAKQEAAEAHNALSIRITAEVDAVRSSLAASIKTLSDTTDIRFADQKSTLDTLSTSVKASNVTTTSKLQELEASVIQNKEKATKDIKNLEKSVAGKLSVVDTRIDTVSTRVDVQAKRINSLISLEPGSTTGDGELADIRVGYDGNLYDTAGQAVRAIGDDVTALRNSLSQYIDTQAIDGLYYDYTGDVGLMQPYMLYLTTAGQVLEDSGVQIISGSGGGGGGGTASASSLKIGYITTSPVTATTNDEVKLKFTFEGTDSSGDTILQAAATWKVNNATVEYGTVVDGDNEFDVTKYLSVGTTKVLLVVTDDNGSVVTKSWTIQQIALSISSQFDEKSTYPANEEIIFTYIPTGSIEKTAVFTLDGKPLDRVLLSSDISGTEAKYRIPPQPHGSHLLEFYLEANINGKTVTSNTELKDLLFYDTSASLPVIGTPKPTLKTKQYSTVNILYTVYDPKSETPTVTIYADNKAVSTITIKPNPSYNNTPTGVYSYTETQVGTHEIRIVCGDQSKTITVDVDELGINITPITTGLAFDFNPVGHTNGDITNRLWSDRGVNLTVSENFDWTNGGYIPDDQDGPCFCVKAGSLAYIDYKLFADDAKKFGKEFKLIFKTKNVANPDAVFLSCLDNTTDKDHIGLKMGVHAAHIYGQSGNLELSYSEEDLIEFEFNISKNTEKVPMVMGYEDGVPSRPMVYDDETYSFTQSTPKVITIGSPDCDVYIYRFKVYNTSLTNTDILNNFIADARSAEEMIDRYNRNQIYDENHKLTPDAFAEKCPWLRVFKVSAPHFTNNKSDKVKKSTIQLLFKNGDPILDNWTCYNAQHSGQGTSSNNYGAAGRNLDFIMNKSGAYFELGDGTITDKITLTRTSVPVAYLNAKVNIASSNNLTNAILANRYNTFNPYRRPFVPRDGIDSSFIKDTMEFHNCVIFIQETDPDLSTHREFADNDWHFYAIGNIGDSKKTDNTRTTDPDDKYECCVEIMDVGLPLSDFPVDTMINAMNYSTDEKTGERIYQWAKNENLDILYELIDGEYKKTTDTEVNLEKTYYVDILEHDDFSEDFTYGWRYITDDEDEDVVNTCKQAWIDFYRFVTTASDEEFKSRLSDYFVVDSALYYYLFTTRYCMVDNRAKNTFWHYSKTADGTRKWDLCWDYDNDTSLGLNNYGKQVYRYGLEDIDRDEAGEEVFRESDSLFFCRIRDLFANELKAMYKDLETKNAWHAESFLNACDAWQNEFPEELWRLDIERKYIRTYTSSFINGKGDAQFLTNMCNGRMKYHRRQWERSQEQYMASKFQTARAYSDSYHANFRVNRFDSTNNLAIKPNYQLTLTPFSYIYLNVWYGDVLRTPYSVRAVPNQPTTVPCPASLEADIINVGSAAAIRDFGDLSASYPKTVSIGNASRVKKLVLGNENENYDNAAFTMLTTDANPLLEEINIENISSINNALNFSKLVNLKKLFAYGTNLSGVTFAQGGKVEEVELPAVNNITLKQLKYLTADKYNLSSYDNVVDITIEECPLINKLELFNKCQKLKRARIFDIDFGRVSYEYFSTKVFGLKGLNAAGEETPDAILQGRIRFISLTGAQYNDIIKRYPQLEVSYDYLISTVTFKGTDNTITIHELTSENAADCSNPVHYGDQTEIPDDLIAKPVKAPSENGEFNYDFLGWSTEQNIIVSVEDSESLTDEMRRAFREDAVKHVEGDRVLYPVFEAIRRSYKVLFINPTAAKNSPSYVALEVNVPYGSKATYSGLDPKKLDVKSPDLYGFVGWLPDPAEKIIHGEFSFEAQFDAKDQDRMDAGGDTGIDDGDTFPGYTIGWLDISDLVDKNGKVYQGYYLGHDSAEGVDTLNITECGNKWNTSVRVPEFLEKDGKRYYILNLNGFAQCNDMELILLPENLKSIQASCFSNCYNLFDIVIPEKVTTIGMNAFKGCNSLDDIHIPAATTSIGEAAFAGCSSLQNITVAEDNPRYIFDTNHKCLVDTNNAMLLHGTGSGSIPIDGSVQKLGEYCFASSKITSIWIPSQITIIPSNAFSRCEQLTEVTLPSTLKTLSATCFAWCYKLEAIELPEGLLDISTFVFNSCPLKRIEIPASVNIVNDRSFANISSLEEVVFRKTNADGTPTSMPNIHERAFEGSGTTSKPIKFYWPSEWGDPPSALWNATNASSDNVIKY